MSREVGSEINAELVELLRERRFKLKLKQSDVAERLGWSQRTVSQIETGQKRVTVAEFLELAKALEFDAASAIRRLGKAKSTASPK